MKNYSLLIMGGSNDDDGGGGVDGDGSGGNSPSRQGITVIDFNANWCGPCRRFAPIFHQVAEELNGRLRFISVDVDKTPEPARQFGVSSIPQITVLRPDGTSYSAVGFMGYNEFLAFIDR